MLSPNQYYNKSQEDYLKKKLEKKRNIVMKNKVTISMHLSIITSNVNGLNAPIKRDRVAEWKKTRPIYMLPPRDPSQNRRHRLRAKGCKKIFHSNGNKKVGETILTSGKIDFKTKDIIRDKEEYYMLVKVSVQQWI